MKKKAFLFICLFVLLNNSYSQNPRLSAWLRNTTIKARHYDKSTGSLIQDNDLANVQSVKYTGTDVYISTTGLPSYITGPFLDMNPNVAGNQNAIFKFPLNPIKNTGTPVSTTAGNIGVFINGVALFDYRDGVAWNNSTQSLCGGPGNSPCPGGPNATQAWNRDAIVAERIGFDCSKGHPAGTNYHHHQNPSAFNLDLNVISTVCNLYTSDALYVINPNQHSPLLGFAYDGFPIYGAYAYKDTNGTGIVTRMKSSYQLKNITTRVAGAPINTTYPLGYFREDYEYIANTSTDYLDEHNGRFCKTPEFPNGTYAYFCTVDINHNSAYPYVVGPTFYGTITASKVTSIPANASEYTGPILPLEIVDFSGYLKNESVELQFTTNDEVNIRNYQIEYSNDGKDFFNLHSFLPQNNKTNIYRFKDNKFTKNIKFYRVKINFLDGKISYTKTISMAINSKNSDISIFPNPTSSLIIVQANGLIKENIFIKLYSLQGKLLKENTILQGSTISYLDVQDLPNGSYLINVKDGNSIKSSKIIINH